MFSKASLASTLLLIAAVAGTSWFALKATEIKALPENSTIIDGIAMNIHLMQYSDQGQLAYEGNAIKAIQYDDQSSALFDLSGIYYSAFPQPPWHALSDKAFITPSGNQVDLEQHVKLFRHGEPNYIPLEMLTSQLFIYPKNNSAYTPAPVTLSQPGTHNITHAVGMRATSTPLTVDLLSQVDSTYEPPQKTNSPSASAAHATHS